MITSLLKTTPRPALFLLLRLSLSTLSSPVSLCQSHANTHISRRGWHEENCLCVHPFTSSFCRCVRVCFNIIAFTMEIVCFTGRLCRPSDSRAPGTEMNLSHIICLRSHKRKDRFACSQENEQSLKCTCDARSKTYTQRDEITRTFCKSFLSFLLPAGRTDSSERSLS